jgi:hypothetical protein
LLGFNLNLDLDLDLDCNCNCNVKGFRHADCVRLLARHFCQSRQKYPKALFTSGADRFMGDPMGQGRRKSRVGFGWSGRRNPAALEGFFKKDGDGFCSVAVLAPLGLTFVTLTGLGLLCAGSGQFGSLVARASAAHPGVLGLLFAWVQRQRLSPRAGALSGEALLSVATKVPKSAS